MVIIILVKVSQQETTDAFVGVNQAVTDVNPASLGEVVEDKRIGTGQPLSQAPARIMTIIATGSVDSTNSKISTLLESAGFTKEADKYWSRTKDGKYVAVSYTLHGPGYQIQGKVLGQNQTALLLDFTSGS